MGEMGLEESALKELASFFQVWDGCELVPFHRNKTHTNVHEVFD